MRTSTTLAALVATGLPLLATAPAQALSCVGPDDVIADADQVFTGRIVDSADGRLLLAVEEVWKGGPVEERVWMDVDLPGWSQWADGDGEVPDGYSSPHRWVFAPYDASVGPCTAWRADHALVRAHAPEVAGSPLPDGALDDAGEAVVTSQDEVRLVAAAGAGLGVGAVATVLTLLLLRRRSPLRRSRRHPG